MFASFEFRAETPIFQASNFQTRAALWYRSGMSLLLTGLPGKGFRETAFFRPRSVLLRADPALPETAILARNLAAGGFHGTLMGDGFASPEGAPDIAILAVPPEAQAGELARIAAMGCFGVVVPTAAPALAAMAAAAGLRALGERSFGLALPGIGLNATLSHLPIRPGKIALMAQSSAIARAVIDWAAAEGLGFSHVIGIGANDDLGFAPGLDWLAQDSGTACVLLELRRIKQRRLFVSATRAVARTRPVLALRPGGRMDDPSGIADAVMAAVLRRAGAVRAEGLEEWLAAAETLARTKPRGGAGQADRLAIIANGLGVARLAGDAALAQGLRLAEFSPATLAALVPLLPEGWQPRNPLSLGSAAGARLAQAAKILAGAAEVDVVIALHAPEQASVPTEAFAEAARGNRGAPILLGWTGEASAKVERAALTLAGLPVFATPEAVVRGLRTSPPSAAIAPPPPNCRIRTCWRFNRTVRRCVQSSRRRARPAGCTCSRMRRWRCWRPMASAYSRTASAPRQTRRRRRPWHSGRPWRSRPAPCSATRARWAAWC